MSDPARSTRRQPKLTERGRAYTSEQVLQRCQEISTKLHQRIDDTHVLLRNSAPEAGDQCRQVVDIYNEFSASILRLVELTDEDEQKEEYRNWNKSMHASVSSLQSTVNLLGLATTTEPLTTTSQTENASIALSPASSATTVRRTSITLNTPAGAEFEEGMRRMSRFHISDKGVEYAERQKKRCENIRSETCTLVEHVQGLISQNLLEHAEEKLGILEQKFDEFLSCITPVHELSEGNGDTDERDMYAGWKDDLNNAVFEVQVQFTKARNERNLVPLLPNTDRPTTGKHTTTQPGMMSSQVAGSFPHTHTVSTKESVLPAFSVCSGGTRSTSRVVTIL